MHPAQTAASTKEIIRIFAAYRAAQATDGPMVAALTDGKLYELFVLSRVVQELDGRGFKLRFVGSKPPGGAASTGHSTLKFKSSPGMMKKEDSHFEVTPRARSKPKCFLFVNIEFDTLGEGMTGTTDLSRRHELDIVLTTAWRSIRRTSRSRLASNAKRSPTLKREL